MTRPPQPPRPAGETPDPVLTARANARATGPTRAQVLQVFADTDQGRVPLDASDIARQLGSTWQQVQSLLASAAHRGYVEPARYSADAFLITDRGLGYLAALTPADCDRNGHRMRGPFPTQGSCADCGWTDPPLSSILTVVHGDDAATTPTHTGQTTLMCDPAAHGQAERTAFLIAARDLFALRLRERAKDSWPVRVWLENNSPDDNPTGTLLYTAGDLQTWSQSAATPARGLMTFADGSNVSDSALVRVTF